MIKDLIAPCGINCGICKSHYREKNTCPGCRKLDKKTPKTRFNCIIRECKILKDRKWKYCFDECDTYPCKSLKSLDKRYSTKYHTSMIENLKYINEKGINAFLEKEKKKWTCPQCGGIITCHGSICLTCGFEK
ncbi:MAG: hypothetical protein BV457_04580 [Thermoplasmata archaeon M9B1D]|nr:MAG: hypothetical protein BV457_04580 [Thermoplasmata archaeon M9B1D]PNX51018.1 MAG: hypothetical protein BV456_04700 [Thermoplasmata archaeon M8B2D]